MVLHQVGSGLLVAEMSRRACDAALEVRGIGPAPQHVGVVVGLDNEVVSPVDISRGGIGDVACIGSKNKRTPQDFHAIADGVVGIVGYFEGGDGEVAKVERDVLLDVVHGRNKLLRGDVVAVVVQGLDHQRQNRPEMQLGVQILDP